MPKPQSTDDCDDPAAGTILDDAEQIDESLLRRLDRFALEVRDNAGPIVRTVGDYELGDCLGVGGMGAVFRARHNRLGHEVAVKLIRRQDGDANERTARFLQEARTAAGIRHPNLVSVHQLGTSDEGHYLVMDLIEGPSLAAGRPDCHDDWQTAVAMMQKIAEAVAELHRNAIIHRDIKPANILVDGNGEPHLADFGLAKLLEQATLETNPGSLVGTPRYMSPEQARGETVTRQSDLFSLGATFYELLTGQPAFAGDHPLESVRRVIETEPVRPRSLNRRLPPGVERVLLKCMAKPLRERYGTADELIQDLRRVLVGEPPMSATVDPTVVARRQFRRSPDLWVRTVGLLLAAGLVQANDLMAVERSRSHWPVIATLLVWLATSIGLWWWQRRTAGARVPMTTGPLPLVWSAVDVVFLTGLLLTIRGERLVYDSNGPLYLGYAVIIAASGFWIRRDAVWLTTLLSIAGYAVVRRWSHLTGEPPHYPLLVAIALGLVGLATAQQVFRVRWMALAERNNPPLDA